MELIFRAGKLDRRVQRLQIQTPVGVAEELDRLGLDASYLVLGATLHRPRKDRGERATYRSRGDGDAAPSPIGRRRFVKSSDPNAITEARKYGGAIAELEAHLRQKASSV